MRGYTGFHHAPGVNAAKGPRDHDERISIDGGVLHIAEREGFYEVWLNTEVSDFDGIHIGEGETRGEALADAIKTLETAIVALRQPKDPPKSVRRMRIKKEAPPVIPPQGEEGNSLASQMES